jgi:hypothetical protein
MLKDDLFATPWQVNLHTRAVVSKLVRSIPSADALPCAGAASWSVAIGDHMRDESTRAAKLHYTESDSTRYGIYMGSIWHSCQWLFTRVSC